MILTGSWCPSRMVPLGSTSFRTLPDLWKISSTKIVIQHLGDCDKLYLFHFLAFWLLLELNDCDRVGLAGPLGESLTPHLMMAC